MLSSRRRGGRRWRETLTGRRGRRRAHTALRRIRPLDAPRTHVLLLQGPGHAERHVTLVPCGRTLATGRSVLLPTSGLVLVIGMLAFVDEAQPVGLLDEGFLIVIGEKPGKQSCNNIFKLGCTLQRYLDLPSRALYSANFTLAYVSISIFNSVLGFLVREVFRQCAITIFINDIFLTESIDNLSIAMRTE